MNVRIALFALSIVTLSGAGSLAHEGGMHVMGTVAARDADHLAVKNREGQTVSIRVTKDTIYHRGDAPAAAADLEVGVRVVIDVVGTGEDLTATEVRFGAESPKSGRAGHPHADQP